MSVLKATTISNLAGDKTIGTDRVAQGTAAAWVNFNGTGTVAISANYNVSSITDNGTGDFTVNFAVGLTDANYSVGVVARSVSGNIIDVCAVKDSVAPTTSALRVVAAASSTATLRDPTTMFISVFR